jgi:signal transduction histidine kinase
MSREAAQALDEMVWAVKPSNDTLANLADYLCLHAGEFFEETSIRVRFELPASVPARPLPAEVRHEVFLAAKEALNNIVKHARATEVRIGLEVGPDGFAVTVSDDGIGLPAVGARGPGDGIANMRRRIQQVGGTSSIGPAEGGGTCLRFEVPLPRPAGDAPFWAVARTGAPPDDGRRRT